MPRFLPIIYLFVSLMLVLGQPTAAQTSAQRVAFLNASGQLVVSSADGVQRWIITNPGENLVPNLGFTWSPNGDNIFYAVQQDGAVSLRIGDVNAQTSREIARVGGNISGGGWLPDGRLLLAGAGLPTNDPALFTFEAGQLISPYLQEPGQSAKARSAAPDGSAIFYRSASGTYALQSPSQTEIPLPLSNDIQARDSGLWATNAPFVAYWGQAADGRSALAVSESRSGATILLPSAGNTPIAPIAWLNGVSSLIYRDSSSQIRIADVSCLLSGCSANPLETGTLLLPASAMDVYGTGEWIVFKDGELVQALSTSCIAANTCQGSAIVLGQQAAPRSALYISGQSMSYSAYTNNPLDPADRDVRILNLGCLPNCEAPRSILPAALAGPISRNGAMMLVDIVGSGLHILDLNQLSSIYLSGPYSEAGLSLLKARWN